MSDTPTPTPTPTLAPGRVIVGQYATINKHSFPFVGTHTFWDVELKTKNPVITRYQFTCVKCHEKYTMYSDKPSPDTTYCPKESERQP